MIIESAQNPTYKQWKKLQTKKGREQQQSFLIEGEHLVQEALQSEWEIEQLITTSDYVLPSYLMSLRHKRTVLGSSLFMQLSETTTPQGLMAVVRKPEAKPFSDIMQKSRSILILDRVQDPGNVGTMIRLAAAAALDAVIIGEGTVDPFSSKVIRSSQGALFHVPICQRSLVQICQQLHDHKWFIYGTTLEQAKDYRECRVDEAQRYAILIGNEGSGVDTQLLNMVNQRITIPIWGKAESLNAAMAAAVLVYHFQGQRQIKKSV